MTHSQKPPQAHPHTPPQTPYTSALAGEDPLLAIADSLRRIESLTSTWTADDFERPWAPGKWSASALLTHLAHSEMVFGFRVRMALAAPGFAAADFDQDAWMRHEQRLVGPVAARAYLGLGHMNLAFFKTLSATDRQASFTHPAFGALTVDWVIHQLAGHQRHHLPQLESVGRR